MRIAIAGLAAALLAGCAGGMDEQPMEMAGGDEVTTAPVSMAHAHMGHVTDAWEDTPEGMGLLSTARAEAEIAAEHAALAAQRPDDLEWMQMHAAHVVHALDPSAEPAGPGLGYGVKPAAQGTARHIGFASEAEDASDNVRLHAEHVATSANNVVTWADATVVLAQEVQAADSAEAAAPLVMEMEGMTRTILDGVDENGDGDVSWEEGEGGIAQAEQHMGFMRQGEGMS